MSLVKQLQGNGTTGVRHDVILQRQSDQGYRRIPVAKNDCRTQSTLHPLRFYLKLQHALLKITQGKKSIYNESLKNEAQYRE